MARYSSCLRVAFAGCLATGVAVAQGVSSTASVGSAAAASAPVAYVYVASQPGGTGHIYGYAA